MFRGLFQRVSDSGADGCAAQDAPDGITDGKSGDAVQNLITVSGARPTLKLSERYYNVALVVQGQRVACQKKLCTANKSFVVDSNVDNFDCAIR
jgi:hypothetical protein